MTDEEIRHRVSTVKSIQGTTVNERLYATDLMAVFDRSKTTDKELARRILLFLKVDSFSIDKILN